MRFTELVIAAGLVAVMYSTMSASEATQSALYQPAFVQQAAFEQAPSPYYMVRQDADQSPSDPGDELAIVEGGCMEACGAPCRQRSCGFCNLGEAWELPTPRSWQCRGIDIGGWVSSGIQTNSHGAPDNGPLGFNDLTGFNMHQLWFYAEKATDTGGCGTDIGFRFDYVFGVDGPDTQAFGDNGWDAGWNSSRDYGSAIPQLYAELAVNDLTVKVGHFYTIIGWEVVTAPDNFFYSHSYTMYYAEPFTHTGFLATYSLTDRITAHGGWTMGWDSGWENLNDGSMFLGGLSLALSDRATLTWALTTGKFGAGRNGLADGDVYMNSIVFEYALTDNLTYLLQHDLGNNSGLGAADNEWYGINQYLQYNFNDCWAVGGRFEWFRDDDGARVGDAGNYYEATLGVNYRPHANVMFRPEIRWDWFDGIGLPFNQGRSDDQFSGGFDVIMTF